MNDCNNGLDEKSKMLKVPMPLYGYIVLVPFLLCSTYIIYLSTGLLYPLLLGFTVTFVGTLMYAGICYGFFSLYCIFLYTNIFFVYSIVFFEVLFPFFDYDFLSFKWPMEMVFSTEVGVQFILASYIEIYVVHVFYCINIRKEIHQKNEEYSPFLIQLGIYIMAVFFIPALVKTYYQVSYVMQYGYIAIFTDGLSTIDYPFWVSGAYLGLTAGYSIFLAGNPTKEQFKKFSLLYILISFLSALKGQRGGIVSLIIICIFWYKKKYNVKIKAKKILLTCLVIGILIVGIDFIRTGYGVVRTNSESNTPEMIIDILLEQSRSRMVPMLVMDRELQYRHYPFVFSPLFTPYYAIKYGTDQTSEVAINTNDISSVAMYNISPSVYLYGGGTGGSFLAEAYDLCGYFGVAFLSCILAYILSICDKNNLNIKNVYIPLMFQFMLVIPLLPRNRMFGFMHNYPAIVLTYIILIIVLVVSRKNEKFYSNVSNRRK